MSRDPTTMKYEFFTGSEDQLREEWYDNDLINSFRLTGSVISVDERRSNALTIMLQTDSRPDVKLNNTGGLRKATSRFLVRVPRRLATVWRPILEGPSCIITVTGHLHGFVEVLEDRSEFLMTELDAIDIRFVARYGSVVTFPPKFKPHIEKQRSPEEKAAAEAAQREAEETSGDEASDGEASGDTDSQPSANPAGG